MGNYVKSTNFASKDSLAIGNPLKIVKGTEIDTEFNNIAIASATKADSLSAVLTGVPTAPTAAVLTNTTQLATTAFVQAALAAIYPVGTVYTNAGVATNPAATFGFGTWAAFGTGKVLVGVDLADPLFDTLGETGGSKDSVVVSHTHTDSGHTHAYSTYSTSAFTPGGAGVIPVSTATGTTDSGTANIQSTGVSGTNANVQPYITVYMWKRTA